MVFRPTLAFGVDPSQGGFSPLSVASGRYPAGPGELAIDGGTADKTHYALGDTVPVSTRGPLKRSGCFPLLSTYFT